MSPELTKVATAAFFDELRRIADEGVIPVDVMEKAASVDVEELLKEAINFGSVRNLAGNMAGGVKNLAGAARTGLNAAAARVSPTLAKPVSEIAHGMQHSKNPFVAGMGEALHHKSHSVGQGALALANPVGTAAEVLATGAGTAASKGLANVGGKLQNATAAADAVMREGRAMTPKGRLLNRMESLGAGMQRSFSEGGTGHKLLTKTMPLAAELGGAVAAGTALHAPVGLAGVAGKMGLVGLGKAAPVIGTAMEHAPHLVDAAAQKLTPMAKGIGGVLHHAAEDVVGTKGQGIMQRLGERFAGGHGAHQFAQAAHH